MIKVESANDRYLRTPSTPPVRRTTAYRAPHPLRSVPTKVCLLNRLPTLDLGDGDYSSCPGSATRLGRRELVLMPQRDLARRLWGAAEFGGFGPPGRVIARGSVSVILTGRTLLRRDESMINSTELLVCR
jgi:hypothetical protein